MRWHPRFSRSDPLTMRWARTIAEAESDPAAWWEGPEPQGSTHFDRACWIVAVVLIVLLCWALLRVPG